MSYRHKDTPESFWERMRMIHGEDYGRSASKTTDTARLTPPGGGDHRFREIDELRSGLLDEVAVDVFTRGHCHSLAVALHELTGLSIATVYNWDEPYHFVVRIDHDRYLDIEGCWTERQLLARWHDGWIGEIRAPRHADTLNLIEDLVEQDLLPPLRVMDALPFARALCQREGIEIAEPLET